MFRFDYFSCGKWDDGIYKFYDFTWRHSRLCYRIFYSDICNYSIRKRKNKKETQINFGSANRKNTGETVIGIKIVSAYDRAEEVRRLFEEYTDMLVENDPSFQEYLDIQNYSEEMEHLEKKYGLPDGRLYLAYCDEELAGCIGLRKMDSQNCEMKRLYVRPAFRGRKIGNLLVEKIIDDAKKIGYSYMLLDTLPFLKSAIHMYKKYGFYEINSYNDSPMNTSIYMKLNL